MKGFTRYLKPLEILTEEQVEAIHRGTLEVLETTGLRIEHERALKVFEKNGCKVDYDEMRVRFPPGLIEECLYKAPNSFRVRARDPKNDLMMGGNTLYFGPSPGMGIVDLDTWEMRTATRQEFYDGVTVLDALETVHYQVSYTPYFGFEGIPPVMCLPEVTAGKIRNSTKFMSTGTAMGSEVFQIEMAKAVGMEIMSNTLLASPPLTYCHDAVEAAFRVMEAGFPLFTVSGGIFGGTAPATIAGATITGNAEAIAGIALAQLVKPGMRVMASHFAFPQNMRSGSPAFGNIGCFLHTVVFNQMWRKYQIPTFNFAVGLSNSKEIDFQNGYERAIPALLSALSGANVITLHGGVHGELTHHPIQAILDDDIAGMIGRFIEGVEVNEETLALDLIDEVGPIPGFYLNTEHTRKWWKREQFLSKTSDRLTYPEWREQGKKNTLNYARERMEEILATHKPTPLTPRQEADISNILEEARSYYRQKGLI